MMLQDASEPPDTPRPGGRAKQVNPIDTMAETLADWILEISDEMADAIVGGVNAPFAAQLTEQEKLAYYSRAFFNPDGSPNLSGRDQEIQRLGPEGFAQVLKEVLDAHPEWKTPPPAAPLPIGLPGGM